MKSTWVQNATVVVPGESSGPGTVVFADKISAILPAGAKPPTDAVVIDGRGRTLTPGLVDLHTHGIGHHLYESRPQDLIAGLKTPAHFGVTSVLPTLYRKLTSASLGELESLTAALADVRDVHVPGFHLEGPFLAITGAGCHTLDPDLGLLDELLAACRGRVSAMSVSPEMPGVLGVIERLVERRITPFLTHTRASYEQTWSALDAGATHATHFYDVFPLPPDVDPGVRPVGAVEAFLAHPRSTIDFICDGVHVHPGAIKAAIAARGAGNIVAITDSNIGAGLAAGVYPTTWGYPVNVSPENAARIIDPGTPRHGALAGSSLTMNLAVKNLRKWLDLPDHACWAMASSNPARVIGMADRGVMRAGAIADLVLWNPDFTATHTWVNGELVYQQEKQ